MRPVCWHNGTWKRKQTTVYYDCKTVCTTFLARV
jgi:hypothetical protein